MQTMLRWIGEQWPCISSAGFMGFVFGLLATRYWMAPSFCPRCLRHNQWVKDFNDKKTPEEKAKSRFFYWMRRKDKKPPES